jgi:CRISPR/Cas system-associated exonuclease Cas4 (RecB family)
MNDSKPNKLSRSKIELFCECPRCFILDQKFKITRPSSPPFTLNNAVDALWKREFDLYRAEQKPHPVLLEHGLNVTPFQHESIDDWRNNRRGVQFLHEPTRFLVYGAPDEVCISADGELVVIDVKATSKASEINLDADWQISYKRQMEIYQWLLRQNGFKVSPRGYFVYCNGRRDENSSGTSLAFDVSVLPYEGDDFWIEPLLHEIHASLLSEQVPNPSPKCKFCQYLSKASEALTAKTNKMNA